MALSPKTSDKEIFYTKLADFKQRFAAMQPELEVTLRNPEEGVEGFVVVWNTGICKDGFFSQNGRKGAGKGGTRIVPGLTLENVKRLARAMAEKNAAAGLPMGGAKSGLNADPNDPSYERKYRRFAKLVKDSGILFEDGGIFGGFGYDIGGKPPLNAIWACEEVGSPNSFTGKPVDMGGTDYDREGIAGLGVAVAARVLLERRAKGAKGATFAVQGGGAMGAAVIRYFSEYGGILKFISDPKYGGTWALASGASVDLVKALSVQELELVKSLLAKEGKLISADSHEVLYQDVDILFPCALEDVLRADNAEKVKARFIAEGANNPTQDEAHKILAGNNIMVMPDIIANPGGVISAFVELTSPVSVEDNRKTRRKVDEAKALTIDRVTKNAHELVDIVEKYGALPQDAGDYLAYRNIFEGIPK